MFRSVIPAVLAVALTACGGGGGETATTTPAPSIQSASPMLGDMSRHRSAIVDLRFDQSDQTQQGYAVTSFQAVSPMIDHIKSVGFDTVTMQTNIPIDPNTGQLVFYDPDVTHSNRDKRLPKDFWPLVRYAKQQGLKVALDAQPVNYINDNQIQIGRAHV